MAQPSPIPGLAELRVQIDALDSQLLELLSRRACLSLAVGQAKIRAGNASVHDPAREAQLLASLAERNPGPLTPEHIKAIWGEIMAASRSLQTQMRASDTDKAE
jgi:chorismate mutase/prephenate dehydratase